MNVALWTNIPYIASGYVYDLHVILHTQSSNGALVIAKLIVTEHFVCHILQQYDVKTKKHITSSVYDCTVEDVEYHNVSIVTHIRHLVTARHGYAVTSSTLLADPPSNETTDVFYIKNVYWSSRKVTLVLKLKFSRQIFEKYANLK